MNRRLSELPVVREPDERLKRHDTDESGMDQVIGELAGGEVVAELPTVAAKDEECANGVASGHIICETHDLERDLLLGGAAGLRPLEGDEDAIIATGRDCVDLVGAPGRSACRSSVA
jgi:hypothetical protein